MKKGIMEWKQRSHQAICDFRHQCLLGNHEIGYSYQGNHLALMLRRSHSGPSNSTRCQLKLERRAKFTTGEWVIVLIELVKKPILTWIDCKYYSKMNIILTTNIKLIIFNHLKGNFQCVGCPFYPGLSGIVVSLILVRRCSGLDNLQELCCHSDELLFSSSAPIC